MSLHSQLQLVSCLAGNNGRRTKQDQNTKSVFVTSQKNVMIDSLESSVNYRRVRIEIEPESEAVRGSLKTLRTVSVLCFGR